MTVPYTGSERAGLLDDEFMESEISRTPMTVSLLIGGVLVSKTTHFPEGQCEYKDIVYIVHYCYSWLKLTFWLFRNFKRLNTFADIGA